MTPERLAEARLADAAAAGAAPAGGCPDAAAFWGLVDGTAAPGEVGSLLDHAARCAECARLLRLAESVRLEAGLAPAPAAPARGARLWALLAGSVLRPLPALAYLLALALSWPVYRALTGPPGTPMPETTAPEIAAAASPPGAPPTLPVGRVLRLEGDLLLRGTGPARPPRVVPVPGETLVLLAFPDVEGLAPGAGLRVRLLHGAEVHADLRRRVADLGPDGSLAVLVEPALLPPEGGIVRLEIDEAEGAAPRVLFRQTLLVGPPA